MGEVLTLPIARAGADEWSDVVDRLRTAGFEVWAMTPAGDADDIWDLPVPERLAVCLGAEGPGLSRTLLSRADRRVRIPIAPAVDSLNVAQAAAVTFAATTRQMRRGVRPRVSFVISGRTSRSAGSGRSSAAATTPCCR